MRIDVETAMKTVEQYRSLNRCPLEWIVFLHEGREIKIDPDVIRKFSFLGLNNTDFLRWYFGKEEFLSSITIARKDEDPVSEEHIDGWINHEFDRVDTNKKSK